MRALRKPACEATRARSMKIRSREASLRYRRFREWALLKEWAKFDAASEHTSL